MRTCVALLLMSAVVLGWHADVIPSSSGLKSQLRRVEVNSVGQMIGYEIVISRRPRMSLWVSGTGRIQWLMLSLPKTDVLIAPGGQVSLGQLQHKGIARVGFDNINRLVRVDGYGFAYQTENRSRLDRVSLGYGTLKFDYHTDGRFRQIGRIKLHYFNNGLLKQVLQTSFDYDRSQSRVSRVGPLKIKAHMNGRVISIGAARFHYHSVQGHILGLSGVEKRAMIQVLWYNSNNCYGFQRQGGNSLPRKSPYPY